MYCYTVHEDSLSYGRGRECRIHVGVVMGGSFLFRWKEGPLELGAHVRSMQGCQQAGKLFPHRGGTQTGTNYGGKHD